MKNYATICNEIVSYNRPEKSKSNLSMLYSTIDLTNLNAFAQTADINALCQKALQNTHEGIEIPNVAAVCIYPVYVALCKELLQEKEIEIATVTAAFPHAQTYSEVKYLETEMAIKHGATEIDIVINISALLNKQETVVFDEIKTIKQICGNKHLKVILETDLLKEASLIEKASVISLEAGADFIKTSTGKDGSIASIEAAYIMCNEIKKHAEKTGFKAGLKPAGGIATTDDALNYMAIVNEVLGANWLNNKLFRLGASRLAGNLLSDIKELNTEG